YELCGLTWLRVPWTPIALIGTAVAFLIGFQNNAAYGRAWEARKIWGGIVNASRSWGLMVPAMINNEYADHPISEEQLQADRQRLIYRHLAWLTTLRYAMRETRPWEVFLEHRTNREWYDRSEVPERDLPLSGQLETLLEADELQTVLAASNKPTAVMTLQMRDLATLKARGLIWEFFFIELMSKLDEFLTLQGKSERIKNFPYPRQYATLGYDFVRVFVWLLPFGVIPEFAAVGTTLSEKFPVMGHYFVWMAVPFTVIVAWVFQTMQRIGTVGENPFEGSANDVPISTIARTIEIDLREQLQEQADCIPRPLAATHGVQM
ncbi:MAG: bestrophin family ion channel, partial [Planctomycetota bacterium]